MAIYVEFGDPIDDWFEASAGTYGQGARAPAGGVGNRAQANDFQFTKKHDGLSADLMSHSARGTQFDAVWVEFYKGKADILYLRYKLINVFIVSLQYSNGLEQVGLNFSSYTYKYFSAG